MAFRDTPLHAVPCRKVRFLSGCRSTFAGNAYQLNKVPWVE